MLGQPDIQKQWGCTWIEELTLKPLEENTSISISIV